MSYNQDSKDLIKTKEANTELLALAVGTYKIIITNMPVNAQQYLKPHIVTALDTESTREASISITNAYTSQYGGTISVIITKCWADWTSNTPYHYDAEYSNSNGTFYISIFSSN